MSKKVLVISTSLRSKSNSSSLADAFMMGASAAGHEVEKISLIDKSIAFCKGCLACQKVQSCVIKDDAIQIAEKMKLADVIVFATPIYYYEMCGQMKTLLDRVNSLYASDYAFRQAYLLTTAADVGEDVDERVIHGFEGWVECFPKVKLMGTLLAGGVDKEDEIQSHPSLKKAFAMGNTIQ